MLEDDFAPDRIVIGGPSDSIIRHGQQNQHGFGAERRMVYKDVGKVGEKISCEYHLTEPVKISMLERSKLVQVVEEFITFCELNFPTSVIAYVEMYPRFVERCGKKGNHMSEDDPWVMDNNRREVERDIMQADVEWQVVQMKYRFQM